MSLHYSRFGPWLSLGLAFGIVVFLVAASGALTSAIGPNLEVVSAPTGDLFSRGVGGGGGGCGGGGAILAFDTSATDPGFSLTGITPCTGTGIGTISKTETFSLAGLNGYMLEDLSGSFTCGVTGGNSLSLSFNSLVVTCPTEPTVGATGTVSGDITFTPVLSGTETLTLSGTGVTGGTFAFTALSNNFSLLAPAAVPEPSSLLLFCTGLFGLVGITRRKLGC